MRGGSPAGSSSDHSPSPEGFSSEGSGWWTGAHIGAGKLGGRRWWGGTSFPQHGPGTLHSHLLGFVSHVVATSSRNCPSLVFLLLAFGGDWKFKRTNEKGPGKSLHKAPLWLPPFPSSCLRTVRGMRNQLPVLTPARSLSPFPRFTNPRIIQLKKNAERKLAEEGGGGRFLAVKCVCACVCMHVCVSARVCKRLREGGERSWGMGLGPRGGRGQACPDSRQITDCLRGNHCQPS